jgi:hypothetical protein
MTRILEGWCDGLAKISDPAERHDGFLGFLQALYANPNAVKQTGDGNIQRTVGSILLAILSWHMPADVPNQDYRHLLVASDYPFLPFPETELELREKLRQLVVDLKRSVGEETWYSVEKGLPVNVRRLFREAYGVTA